MLETEDLRRLLSECRKRLNDGYEFTMECNPDDVDEALAETLHFCGVNRVSLGIQTFSNERLKLINRRHTAEKAREAVGILRAYDINNVSIDLMFGFPGETLGDWLFDIKEAIKLSPSHISAYCLSIEEGTALDKMILSGTLPPLPSENTLESMYYNLCSTLKDAGYDHYEISNFSLPGFHSRHNSGYWQDKSYKAIGAGAHGYEKEQHTRYWNICSIDDYIANVNAGKPIVEEYENIDDITHYNDLITTALRTRHGLSEDYVRSSCTPPLYDYFMETSRRLVERHLVETFTESGDCRVRLSPSKLFVSDDILSELIFVRDHDNTL